MNWKFRFMQRRISLLFWLLLFSALIVTRLCHYGLLWADEDYHIAAAIQTFHGKIPYQDFFYDKPILNLLFYFLIRGTTGCILRIMGALYCSTLCLFTFHFTSRIWNYREGYLAASLMAFFLIFYFPGANIPLQPDTLMILPHLTAVYFAWSRRPFAAGITAGLAFLFNTKGLFVLAACILFCARGLPLTLLGFFLPNIIFLGWLYLNNAVYDYWQQVWQWGFHYINAPATMSVVDGFQKILNWAGFHFTLVIGAAFAYWKEFKTHIRLCGWLALSLVAVSIGWKFGPHYFNQILPPLVISAARGISLLIDRVPKGGFIKTYSILLIISLIIPCIRFGQSYVLLAGDKLFGITYNWKDLTMDRSAKQISRIIKNITKSDDTIFIWGYFPKIIAYTRLPIDSRFLDSQPLTGIPAIQQSTSSGPIVDKQASKYRQELIQTNPEIIVDELGVLNHNLDIRKYPKLKSWMNNYCLEYTSPMAHIYKRCPIKETN